MADFHKKLIIIGASVGGPTAISLVLSEFPQHFSPVIIVQQMYKEMVTPWSKNLQRYFPLLKISVPKNKESIKPDHIYIAEGGKHCEVTENREIYSYEGERINFVVPSVDVTFISAPNIYGENL